MLCNKAVEKWKAFYSHLYVETNEYVLLYENGEEALFLPGSKKEFFSLERYQQELGKDFNRITLFLCTSFDYSISQGLNDIDGDNDILNCNYDDNCNIYDESGSIEQPLLDDISSAPKRVKIGRFYTRDALCVWTNLDMILLFVWLCVYSIKTGT